MRQRSGTPALPLMAPALRRHRQELLRTRRGRQRPVAQRLMIMAAGIAVPRGERDYGSLRPPPWWHTAPQQHGWRWHEARHALFRRG